VDTFSKKKQQKKTRKHVLQLSAVGSAFMCFGGVAL